MGALEEGGKVVSGTVDALKSQPLSLALIVVNIIFLIAAGLLVWQVSARAREESAVRERIMLQCLNALEGLRGPGPRPRPQDTQPP